MSLVDVVFEIGLGAWLALVLMFLWAIERRLAELCAAHKQIVHESNQLPPKPPGSFF
jgi:hypothetical protein